MSTPYTNINPKDYEAIVAGRDLNDRQVVYDLMRQKSIKERSAEMIVRSLKTQAIDTSDVPSNAKSLILSALYLMGGAARNTPELWAQIKKISTDPMVTRDPHALVHVMWACQKDQHVTFAERKMHGRTQKTGDSALVRIRLTKKGNAKAREILGIGNAPGGDVKVAKTNGAHPVGVDYTHPSAHGSKAVGGPIERIKVEQPASPVEPPIKQVVPSSMKTQQNPPASQGNTSASKDASTDTHTQYPNETPFFLAEVIESEEWGKFPLLRDLLGKRERVTRYRKAVELIQDDEQAQDIALALLEKIAISPLEDEVLRLVEAVGRTPFGPLGKRAV